MSIDIYDIDKARLANLFINCYKLEIEETKDFIYIIINNCPIWCNKIYLPIDTSLNEWRNLFNQLVPKLRLCHYLQYISINNNLDFIKLLPYYLEILHVCDFTTITCKIPNTLHTIKTVNLKGKLSIPKTSLVFDFGYKKLNSQQWRAINSSNIYKIVGTLPEKSSFWKIDYLPSENFLENSINTIFTRIL
jgi:hypothetical protein